MSAIPDRSCRPPRSSARRRGDCDPVLRSSSRRRCVAQWPAYPNSAIIPKLPDGKVDLKAPAPRTADGKPDLSGVWETAPCPDCAPPVIDGLSPTPGSGQAAAPLAGARGEQAGRGNAARAGRAWCCRRWTGGGRGNGGFGRNIFGNVGGSTPEGEAPYQPWAKELVQKRMADNSKDNPDAHCLPMGIMQMDSHPYPKKIIQTPTEVLVIYEASGTTVREIFLDGRPLPKKEDVEPWYNGYSVGHWEGDTLVAETTGLMDDGWLDVRGSPLTSAAKADRTLPSAQFRLPRDQGDGRRSEGLHEAVRRASCTAGSCPTRSRASSCASRRTPSTTSARRRKSRRSRRVTRK